MITPAHAKLARERVIDCVAEMTAAADRIHQRHIDHIINAGVSPETLAKLGAQFAPFGVVATQSSRDGLYEPGNGATYIVQPVLTDGDCVDLVAWRKSDPSRWHLRTGLGWALGEDAFTHRSFWGCGEPFPIHRSPLAWLIAGGTGIVILDWEAPELRELIALDVIECDRDLAVILHRRLSHPVRLPRFVDPRGRARHGR
jgi:hypothetical protein